MPHEVACAVEGLAYLPHCATMLRSLLVRHPAGTFRVHLLHGGDLSRGALRRLSRMVRAGGGEIRYLEIPDARVAGLEVEEFTGKATWYRLFLPELLPRAERVLYLDGDVLIVDDLRPLWELDLDDAYLAAVTNVVEPHFAHRLTELGIAAEDYFNAGVLMLDLEQMRRDGCTERMLEVGRAERPLWRDQDVLNIVVGHRRHRLHPRWNCMNILRTDLAIAVHGEVAVQEALDDPAIRHFEGPWANKPWFPGAPSDNQRAYREHRSATPWPHHGPEVPGIPRRVLRKIRP